MYINIFYIVLELIIIINKGLLNHLLYYIINLQVCERELASYRSALMLRAIFEIDCRYQLNKNVITDIIIW